jgi:zinc/manganese transport system substrate-binding protein
MILRWPRLVVASAALLAACGDSGPEGVTDAPDLVATTTIWADIASNVACGEAVAAVIPTGADPHTYEPSLRDRGLIDGADLVIANGGDLEEVLIDLLATTSTPVVEMSTRVDLIALDQHEVDDEHDDDRDAGDGHRHAGGNPHIWHDPARIAGALDLITSALTATDRDAAAIRRCADDYRAELVAVDNEIAGLLAPIPTGARVLVTNHDTLAYFADRYDFDVLGTVLPGSSTLAETNLAQLEELAGVIDRRSVPAIFVDESAPRVEAEALARRAGVDVIPLSTGALDDDGPASTYIGLLRANATTIARALTP